MNDPRALIIGASILGIAASASFAADEFQLFSRGDGRALSSAPSFSQNGAIVHGETAPSTEHIIQSLQ